MKDGHFLDGFFLCPRRLCIASPIALDFESPRLLDRIAYHQLIGADCFLYVIDERNSASGAAMELWQALRAQSHIVALLSVNMSEAVPSGSGWARNATPTAALDRLYPSGDALQNSIIALLEVIRNRRYSVEFFSYLDGDEYLAISHSWTESGWRALPDSRARPTSPSYAELTSSSPLPHLLPFLEHRLSSADAIYLHRWSFGSAGFANLSDAQLHMMPEMAWLNRRGSLFQHASPSGRLCVGDERVWGKMLGRVNSSWRPSTMHHYVAGSIVLPDGRRLPNGTWIPGGSRTNWAAAYYDPCKEQPLSINHYLGTLEQCLLKADHGIIVGNHRRRKQCHRFFEWERNATSATAQRNATTVVDDTVARFARATRSRAGELFATRSHVARGPTRANGAQTGHGCTATKRARPLRPPSACFERRSEWAAHTCSECLAEPSGGSCHRCIAYGFDCRCACRGVDAGSIVARAKAALAARQATNKLSTTIDYHGRTWRCPSWGVCQSATRGRL